MYIYGYGYIDIDINIGRYNIASHFLSMRNKISILLNDRYLT